MKTNNADLEFQCLYQDRDDLEDRDDAAKAPSSRYRHRKPFEATPRLPSPDHLQSPVGHRTPAAPANPVRTPTCSPSRALPSGPQPSTAEAATLLSKEVKAQRAARFTGAPRNSTDPAPLRGWKLSGAIVVLAKLSIINI